jgi:hypothetical protein
MAQRKLATANHNAWHDHNKVKKVASTLAGVAEKQELERWYRHQPCIPPPPRGTASVLAAFLSPSHRPDLLCIDSVRLHHSRHEHVVLDDQR